MTTQKPPVFAHAPATLRLGDLEVVRLGYGAMRLPGPDVWGEPEDPARAREVLRRVVALGMNLIDSAWFYGPHVSNRLIAETLYPYPKDLVIASKLGRQASPRQGVGAVQPPRGAPRGLRDRSARAAPRSARRRSPAVHGEGRAGAVRRVARRDDRPEEGGEDPSPRPLQRGPRRARVGARAHADRLGAEPLQRLRGRRRRGPDDPRRGRRRPSRCSTYARAGASRSCRSSRSAIGAHAKPDAAVAAAAERHHVSPAQIALAWLLARSPVMLPIPGTSRPEHLEENWASRSIHLTADEVRSIATAARAESP